MTPGGALYFHELIVEAQNSAFCGTRVAWCIPSSRKLICSGDYAPHFIMRPVCSPRVRNTARESKWRRGHATIANCYRCRLFRLSSPALSLIQLSRVCRLEDSPPHFENLRNINHFALDCRAIVSFYDIDVVYGFSLFTRHNNPNLSSQDHIAVTMARFSLINRHQFRNEIRRMMQVVVNIFARHRVQGCKTRICGNLEKNPVTKFSPDVGMRSVPVVLKIYEKKYS